MEVPLAEIDRVVKARLGRWRNHPDWEDIFQVGRIEAWRAVQGRRCPEQWKPLAARAAVFALWGFLRSSGHWHRRHTRRGIPCPELLPLSGELPVEDFAPALLERIDFEAWAAGLSVPQRQVVKLHLVEGLTLQETARRLGIARNSAQERLRWALKRRRALLEER